MVLIHVFFQNCVEKTLKLTKSSLPWVQTSTARTSQHRIFACAERHDWACRADVLNRAGLVLRLRHSEQPGVGWNEAWSNRAASKNLFSAVNTD